MTGELGTRDESGITMTTPAGFPVLHEQVRRAFQAIASAYAETARRMATVLHPVYVAQLSGAALREHRRTCRRCPDPPGYPRPLRVNGRDYHRRRKARVRRGR